MCVWDGVCLFWALLTLHLVKRDYRGYVGCHDSHLTECFFTSRHELRNQLRGLRVEVIKDVRWTRKRKISRGNEKRTEQKLMR